MSTPFSICLSTVTAHAAFTDVILFCQEGFTQLGYDVHYSPGEMRQDQLNILFCAQNLTWKAISSNSSNVIVYNWEPASPDIGRFLPNYLRQMVNTHVWDYNLHNVEKLKAAGIQDIHYVPMGYVDSMSDIQPLEVQDIDVLFYGELSPRRKSIIDAIRATGLRVVTSDDTGGMSGAVRSQYIARSKMVLNLHAFEDVRVFEIARVAYLLANSKAVVSETSELSGLDVNLQDCMIFADKEEIAQQCVKLVADSGHRKELEAKGFAAIKQRKASEVLKPAIDAYIKQHVKTPRLIGNQAHINTPLPKKLRIHPGYFWKFDCCNIDSRADFAPDLAINLSNALPWGQTLASWRFGEVTLQKGYFTHIVADSYFQRVDDLQLALTNCLMLLEENGILEINGPLDLSFDASAHIDDKRYFTDQTWFAIVQNWSHYDWTSHRFEIVETAVSLHNDIGNQFFADHPNAWGDASVTPRVMDSQKIILRKCALTAEDVLNLPQHRFLD